MKTNPKIRNFAFLIITFCLFACGLFRIYNANKPVLDKTAAAYREGVSANLNANLMIPVFSSILNKDNRIADSDEADFTAAHILSRIKPGKHLPSLGVLSSSRFAKDYGIPLDSIGRAAVYRFPLLRARTEAMESAMGICHEAFTKAVPYTDLLMNDSDNNTTYRIRITDKNNAISVNDSIVLRIAQHWTEKKADKEENIDYAVKDSVYRYILMDAGAAVVVLPKRDTCGNALYYSLLPIQKGYSFGQAKATYSSSIIEGLSNSRTIRFTRNRAYVMPLSPKIVNDLRESGDITVRTPQQYKYLLIGLWLVFAFVWSFVYLFTLAKDAKTAQKAQYGLIVTVAAITGLGLLTLLALPLHPLQDNIRVLSQMTKGLIPGIILLVVASRIDWVLVFRKGQALYGDKTQLQGTPLGLLAVAFAMALLMFGHGPGGTRVNLLFFQPQPIIKYLAVFFFAIYLANRMDFIPSFASRVDRYYQKRHWKVVGKAVIVLVTILAFQLFFLHDMGPGIVLGLTAVVMYSCCREDVPQMLLGAITYIAIIVLWKLLFGNAWSLVSLLIWIVAWVLISKALTGKVFTSAVLVNIVIAAMVYGGSWASSVPVLKNAGDKISDRVEIWESPFDNHTNSDQLARSIWGLAEGGLTGRCGESMAATVPEAHNDFIYSSLVSNFGLIGGLLLLSLLALLMYYGSQIALSQKDSDSYGYLLATGITASIVIQALFILAGVTGLCPLSGVTLFGMSFGSSALIMDMGATGILLSLSRNAGQLQSLYRKNQATATTLLAITGYVILLFIAVATMWYSCINQCKTLNSPAITQNSKGYREASYSPQINAFINKKLRCGSIYDRKGVLLAGTNEKGGRLYPQRDATFFWTADLNNRTLFSRTGNHPAGVLADSRWRSYLRGFNNHPCKEEYYTDKLHSAYFPDIDIHRPDTLVIYDYSEVFPLWNSPAALAEFNDAVHTRDIHLTLDSHLMQAIIDGVTDFFEEKGLDSRVRFSAVIKDAASGDVLASVSFPFDRKRIDAMAEAGIKSYQDELTPGFQSFADMDLACCHPTSPGSVMKLFVSVAGFRKIGKDMNEHTEYVRASEKIYSHDETGTIPFKNALVSSNNPYFIKTLNSLDLYDELRWLSWQCGVSFNNYLPYCMYPEDMATNKALYDSTMTAYRKAGLKKYREYIKANAPRKINDSEWMLAWGQGPVTATPLAIANLVGAIANSGVLMRSRFSSIDSAGVQARILSPKEAEMIGEAMREQAVQKGRFGGLSSTISGKTGTAERKDALAPGGKSNDALYACYIGREESVNNHPIAIVVRFERSGTATSSLAMAFVREKLLDILQKEGYFKRLS